ncbi:hypothetical protein [Nocardia puris]|uniref:hypothetical protein n=1 Tax=Nocardia puris TaxID=208602 RepID=UPI002E1EC614
MTASDTPPVPTLTADEFARLDSLGQSGTLAALSDTSVGERWRTAHRDWRGRHWAFQPDHRGVLRLGPVNVARRPRTRTRRRAAA